MRITRIIFFIVVLIMTFGCATSKYRLYKEGIFNYIDIRTGVKIYFISHNAVFPDYWYEKPISASFKYIDGDEIERSISIITTALNKYPTELIKNYIKNIFFFRELLFYGNLYGGTYNENNVYIVNNGVINNYTDEFIEKTFHREFSSILLTKDKHKFNEEEWVEISTQDIEYGKGGIEALSSGKFSLEGGYEYYKYGFLNEYSISAMEEDFNEYAGALLTEPDILFELCEKYLLIKRKCELTIEFYNEINSIFTEEYFRNL